jgi:hypothetical protein
MELMHPDLRTGLAEEHILRLEGDMGTRRSAGRTRRLAARLLLTASERLAGEAASAVEGLVDKPVGELVVFTANRRVGDGTELAREAGCLERKLA